MSNASKTWTYPETNNLQDFIGAGFIVLPRTSLNSGQFLISSKPVFSCMVNENIVPFCPITSTHIFSRTYSMNIFM